MAIFKLKMISENLYRYSSSAGFWFTYTWDFHKMLSQTVFIHALHSLQASLLLLSMFLIPFFFSAATQNVWSCATCISETPILFWSNDPSLSKHVSISVTPVNLPGSRVLVRTLTPLHAQASQWEQQSKTSCDLLSRKLTIHSLLKEILIECVLMKF